jgi:putative methyltransferase (TIGR04325 family)
VNDRRLPPFVRATLIAKGLTPPYLWAVLKALRRRREQAVTPADELALAPAEWEYVPEGWARPAGGWDVDAIARTYRAKWPSFLASVAGSGPLGVNHEVPPDEPMRRDDRDAQQTVLVFAYALLRAARGRERLTLLDWGGGPGHYAVFARALLPEVELDYHSRDLPALVALGREVLPEDSFHADDACLDRRYDLVVASSSLHYAEDWRATLGRLARASGGFLLLTRVPVALRAGSFVVLQRAQRYGYGTEYLGWVFNREELLAAAAGLRLELEREFVLAAWLSAAGAPEDAIEHRAFLFRLGNDRRGPYSRENVRRRSIRQD